MYTSSLRKLGMMILFMAFTFVTFAQQNEITQESVQTWFERNWMWVAGGVLLLLIIIVLGRSGSRSRKTTTIVKDPDGRVKSVTTTEINE